MNNDERTTMPTESVGESNVCSENVCSPDRTTSENERMFCTSSERSEKRIKRILNVLYGILAEDYYSDTDSENTPGHKNSDHSERSDSPVQIIRMAREINFIHEKVNSILSRLDILEDSYDEFIRDLKSKVNETIVLARSNNSMCYSIREHAKHAKESLSIITENTTINKQEYGNIIAKLESLPDCTNCWANMGEHKKSERSERIAGNTFDFNSAYPTSIYERSESNTYKYIWESKWSLTDYKKLFEDSRIANFWFYLRNYLYAPVQDTLTDCAEYLFRWMQEEISGYCSEPNPDDISEVQDITIYLDRMSVFYDLIQSHKDDMPTDRYDAYMHIMSDIDTLLSERSDSEVSKLGGDENGNTSGETS